LNDDSADRPGEDVRQKTQGGGESEKEQQAEKKNKKHSVQSFESVSFE
jgi:hypothetical protein